MASNSSRQLEEKSASVRMLPQRLTEALFFELLNGVPVIEELTPYYFSDLTAEIQRLTMYEQSTIHNLVLSQEWYGPETTVATLLERCAEVISSRYLFTYQPRTRTRPMYTVDKPRDPFEMAQLIHQEWLDLCAFLEEFTTPDTSTFDLLRNTPVAQLQNCSIIHELPRTARLQAIFPCLGIYAPTYLTSVKEIFWSYEPLPIYCDSQRTWKDSLLNDRRMHKLAHGPSREWLFHIMDVVEFWTRGYALARWFELASETRSEMRRQSTDWTARAQWALAEVSICLDSVEFQNLPSLSEVFVPTPAADIQVIEEKIVSGELPLHELNEIIHLHGTFVAEAREKVLQAAEQCYLADLWAFWGRYGDEWRQTHQLYIALLGRACQLVSKISANPIRWSRFYLGRCTTDFVNSLSAFTHAAPYLLTTPSTAAAHDVFLDALHRYVVCKVRQFQLVEALEHDEVKGGGVIPSENPVIWDKVTQDLYEDVQVVFQCCEKDVTVKVTQTWEKTLTTTWRRLKRADRQVQQAMRDTLNRLQQIMTGERDNTARLISLPLWSNTLFLKRYITSPQLAAVSDILHLFWRRDAATWKHIPALSHFNRIEDVQKHILSQLRMQNDISKMGPLLAQIGTCYAIE